MAELLIIGCGYSGQEIAKNWLREGHGGVMGTTRSNAATLEAQNIQALSLENQDAMRTAIKTADAIVLSAPPPDPAIIYKDEIAHSKAWLGYLSTTAVYGDHGGNWVDETTLPAPSSTRGRLRLETEACWQGAAPRVNIFRLAGIYGPSRNPIARLQNGKARNIVKAGQVFGRIHVEDIARIVISSYLAGDQGEVYNLTDNLPAPPQDVLKYAAKLAKLPLPKPVPFETAELSPMARNFYEENKRVSNKKIRAQFGDLIHPDFRHGLDAIYKGTSK